MKKPGRVAASVGLAVGLLAGCSNKDGARIGAAEKGVIEKEVKDQFTRVVAAINGKDARAWSGYYSQAGFVSAIVSTDYYASRSAWVDLITRYFAMRERQHVEPVDVRVTVLAPNLALLTSEEKTEMGLKDGAAVKSKHVFTMIWEKEQTGWKILHSHESWVDEPAN